MDARVYIVLSLITTLKESASEQSCDFSLEPKELPVYYGWPVLLKCHDLAEDCGSDGDDYRCNITAKDTNQSIYSSEYDYYDATDDFPSYEITNVTSDLSSEIEISIQNDDGCCSQILMLQKGALPETSCSQFHDTHTSSPTDVTPGSSKQFACVVPYSSDEPKLENIEDYPITFYYNCGTDLPEGVINTTFKNRIAIASFDPFKHIGDYACSIEYNGETRFITEIRYCTKPKRPKTEISILCITNKIRYNIGDTVTIECDVNVGSSDTNPDAFTMNFYPLLDDGTKNVARDNLSCLSDLENERNAFPTQQRTSLDDRVSCSFKLFRRFEEVCMTQIPTQEKWEREKNKTLQILKMTYTMENIQEEDFGPYQAFVRYNTGDNNATDIVAISKDKGEQQRAALIGGVLGGTVAFLIIVGILLYYFRLHLQVWWKRSRCVPYDTDMLEYGAYFTYAWSNDTDDIVANEKYHDLISGMRDYIQKMGFSIYDPAVKPAQCQWDIQNIKQVQLKCQRVIIILTGEFLEQPRAEQELYENFLDKSFILVRTPAFESAFRGLSRDRKNGLQAHFQRNFTIKWSGEGGKLSRKFQMQLELVMPKKRNDNGDETLESRL